MVLSDYLTGKMGWGDRVGRGGRDSPHSPIRVGMGGSSDKIICTKIKEKTCTMVDSVLYYTYEQTIYRLRRKAYAVTRSAGIRLSNVGEP